MAASEFVFWLAVALLLYAYFGYPLLLFAVTSAVQAARDLRFLFRRETRRGEEADDEFLPALSIVIPAHNEQDAIAAKLDNCLALDYPTDRLEILVGSDGSDDRTNDIVASYAARGVALAAYPERRGKAAVVNDTVARAHGEIVVLTDATTVIERDALRRIVRRFRDTRVNAVNGELRFLSPEAGHKGEGLYWKYEVMLKFMENRLGVVLGSSGALCAVRKSAFRPIPTDCICDDLVITLNVLLDGGRAVYDPEARSVEFTAASVERESSRRVRIGAGNFQALARTARLLNPARGWIALSYFSHKVLKWTTWLLLALAFAANIPLIHTTLYLALFLAQIAFYATALLGALRVKLPGLTRLSSVTYYFVAMHAALFRGFLRYLGGSQKAAWQREHR